MGNKKGLRNPENYTYIGNIAIDEKKFFSRLLKDSNGCLVWQNGTHRQGYGMMSTYDVKEQKRKMNVVHRLAMMLHLGRELGRYEFVVHEFCDNQLCCNPAHIIVGTPEDRNRVQYAKGRAPHQPERAVKKQNRKYKWTEEQMRFVRDNPTAVVAAKLGITRSAASHMKYSIKTGYKWLD
jgi:hypothetical protein